MTRTNEAGPGPVVVVGAGAAGLTAAIFAAEHSPVLLLERTEDGGRKILISGGGRCNVLPEQLQPRRFVTDSSPNLLRRMLRAWPLAEQHEFFERRVGVPLAFERESGKWFPASNRARDVRDGLVRLARTSGVEVRGGNVLTGITPVGGRWRVMTTGGTLEASAVVLATGGLSVPATGSDGSGIAIARRLGHTIHEPYPALTPLLAAGREHADLAGISLPVRITARWRERSAVSEGGFLFTHRGYSGPAILDVSHLAVRSRLAGDAGADAARVTVRWCALGRDDWHRQIERGGGRVVATLARHLPQRLAVRLLHDSGMPPDRRAGDLRRRERGALLEALTEYRLPWTGDEGYKKAEVTGGGVALGEVRPETLESRRHPRLFLCGELLDAFGPIGGHNFAWAWATGRTAGRGCAPGGSRGS